MKRYPKSIKDGTTKDKSRLSVAIEIENLLKCMAPEGCEGNTFTFDGAQVRIKESNGCQSYLIIKTTGSGTRNSIRIGKTRLAASDRAIELFLSETWRLVDAARLCLLKHKIEPTQLTEHHFSLLKNRINR